MVYRDPRHRRPASRDDQELMCDLDREGPHSYWAIGVFGTIALLLISVFAAA